MDTTRLRDLVTLEGPFASLYFDDSRDTEDAAKRQEIRWRDLRNELEAQGATSATLDSIKDALDTSPAPVGRKGRAVIANADKVVVNEELAEPPATDVARWSDLPYVAPLAVHGESYPPHLVVLVDHLGADITVFDEHRRPVGDDVVRGPEGQVHKVRGGGSAHRRLQAGAEDAQRRNVAEVATEVTELVRRTGARLVVLAGEIQARTELRDALPDPVRRIATEAESGARGEGSAGKLDQEVAELLIGLKLTAMDDVVEWFRAESGRRDGLSAEGLEGVTAALREGNVEVLLLTDPGDAVVFSGSGPSEIAVTAEEARALGSTDPREHRADEALLFAAIATGAQLMPVDERLELAAGLGAVLRHH